MSVKPIPNGYRSITPYLAVRAGRRSGSSSIDARSARKSMRIGAPDGKVGHAELEIGDLVVMLADEVLDMEFFGPASIGGTSVTSTST